MGFYYVEKFQPPNEDEAENEDDNEDNDDNTDDNNEDDNGYALVFVDCFYCRHYCNDDYDDDNSDDNGYDVCLCWLFLLSILWWWRLSIELSKFSRDDIEQNLSFLGIVNFKNVLRDEMPVTICELQEEKFRCLCYIHGENWRLNWPWQEKFGMQCGRILQRRLLAFLTIFTLSVDTCLSTRFRWLALSSS